MKLTCICAILKLDFHGILFFRILFVFPYLRSEKKFDFFLFSISLVKGLSILKKSLKYYLLMLIIVLIFPVHLFFPLIFFFVLSLGVIFS